ncbi:MAG: SRPBCC domain-containing protein [Salinarimonas sp.]|nr:SRPBCC domain-containing protein [Salinarimonas sp.]
MTENPDPDRPTAGNMKGVIPYIGYGGRAGEAADFYVRAFGAQDLGRMPDPERPARMMHAQVAINDGSLMLTDMGCEETVDPGPLGRAHMQLVVDDGKAWWDRAVSAGCRIVKPYERQFWGDDWGLLEDPFEIQWAVLQPGEAALERAAQASAPVARVAHELTLTREIAAPRGIVWRCWTEPDLIRQWFCPKPWSLVEADFDLRAGGRMNTRMAGPDGENIEGRGIWLEVAPMRRLVFTDAFTEGCVPTPEPFMTGVVALSDMPDGGTCLIWSARHAGAEAMERHRSMGWEQGWNAAVDQLDETARSLVAKTG